MLPAPNRPAISESWKMKSLESAVARKGHAKSFLSPDSCGFVTEKESLKTNPCFFFEHCP
jgi:hypothetical protein